MRVRSRPNSVNLTRLVWLNLPENELTGPIPPGLFGRLTNLQELDLGDNNLYGSDPARSRSNLRA